MLKYQTIRENLRKKLFDLGQKFQPSTDTCNQAMNVLSKCQYLLERESIKLFWEMYYDHCHLHNVYYCSRTFIKSHEIHLENDTGNMQKQRKMCSSVP